MKLNLRKLRGALSTRGERGQINSENSARLLTAKPSGRGKFIKKLFGRVKKGIPDLNSNLICSNEPVYQAVLSGELASRPSTASQSPLEGQICLPIPNAPNPSETKGGNELEDEMPAEAALLVNYNTPSVTQEGAVGGNTSETLRDSKNHASPRFVRPMIRRVISQNDLRHNFDIFGITLASSDHQYSIFGSPIAQSYQHDLADLEEDHELKAAEAEISVLQQRVEDLETYKLTMKVDFEAKEVTVQHLLAGSQSLQERNDKLKEQCDLLFAESEQLQRSALDEIEERKEVQQGLEQAFTAKDALARDLAGAQNQARYFEHRMIELTNALGETPSEVANMSSVIDQKDKMFSDLEMRAGECFTALTKLEEQRSQEEKIARHEIASLKAELGQHENTIERLRKSKDSFQNQCEAVLLMLRDKVRGVDLVNAMDEYFQTAVEDNSFLINEIKRQESQLSAKNLAITSLESAIREREILKGGKNQWQRIEIGIEHQRHRARRRAGIPDNPGADGRGTRRARTSLDPNQDDQIAALEQAGRELSERRQYLEHCLWTQTNSSTENARAACIHAAHAEETLVQWIAAQAEIESQREEMRAWLGGLPDSIGVAEVLAMKKSLGEAQSRIQVLESDGPDAVGESSRSGGMDDDELYGISDEEGKAKKEEEDMDKEESNNVGW
ncbi:hypothetical protein MMC22_002200 [Lobaria immixta]|nr:hypothetical protein [Lobaria immixta]